MRQLVDAVRGAGSTQPVIAEGLNRGSDRSGWLANEPHDPAGQLQQLQPGWNTVTFTIPPTTNGVNELGLQVNDGSGWGGRLVLDSVTF
jgi:hypothetical protein